MKKSIAKIVFLIAQVLIVLLEILGFIVALRNNGIGILGFFTQESNLLMLVAAGCSAVYMLTHWGEDIPRWILSFEYMATCMVTVTFVTVILVLAPMTAPSGAGAVLWLFIGGSNLYHHLLSPVLAIVAFLVFEREYVAGIRDAVVAASPTFLYATVATALNIAKVVRGPYPFLHVYEQPWWVSVIWFIVIPMSGFVFALLFGFIKKKLVRKAE